MKTKNIIWGLILVLIGVLFILKNLDIIYFSWYSLWKLWPMLLVLIGVTILPVKDGIKVVLTIIVLIAAAFFLISFPNFHNWNKDRSINNSQDMFDDKDAQDIGQRIFEAYDSTINEAELIFDAAAGNFRIGQSTEELFEFEREGNLGRYTYSIKDLGEKREIRIELEEGRIIKTDLKNKVEMKLNPNPVWDIKVDVGAANIELDLSSFKIRKLDIDGGASYINIRLGTLQAESKIKINSGASSIDIKVPQEFACEVNTSTVLSSKDLKGFNRVGNGTYVTPDFSDKTKNIVIEVEAAVSSLNVERY
jgi:uncharacterized membrane protein